MADKQPLKKKIKNMEERKRRLYGKSGERAREEQSVKESLLRKEKEEKVKSHFPKYAIKSSLFFNLHRCSSISYSPRVRDSGKKRNNISLKD